MYLLSVGQQTTTVGSTSTVGGGLQAATAAGWFVQLLLSCDSSTFLVWLFLASVDVQYYDISAEKQIFDQTLLFWLNCHKSRPSVQVFLVGTRKNYFYHAKIAINGRLQRP